MPVDAAAAEELVFRVSGVPEDDTEDSVETDRDREFGGDDDFGRGVFVL